MKKLLTFIIFILFSVNALAEKIMIKPDDCGPLARNEYGLVFYVLSNDKKQTYFAKGKANDLCPKILSSDGVIGYEFNLCEENDLFTKEECSTIKGFVVLGYKND